MKHLPKAKLDLENQNGTNFEYLGTNLKNITDWHRKGGQWGGGISLPNWGKETGDNLKALLNGENQPHNNIQPSRIVRFIRFIGF